jgi:hypothetical protein
MVVNKNGKLCLQASTLTFFLTCPFGQLTKKSTCQTQFFKLIKIIKPEKDYQQFV